MKTLGEKELLTRLRVRYSARSGNGIEYAFIPKVRDAAGFAANRTIDAYAMALWRSRGLRIIAFECKSSRSDWLRELRDPSKAEGFCERADFFYLVAGSTQIVHAGELPPTWGLMVPHGAGLRVMVEAPELRGRTDELPPGLDRSFLAALLRQACNVGDAPPAAVQEAVDAAREQERGIHEAEIARTRSERDALRQSIREFEEASGIRVEGTIWPTAATAAEVGAIVKLALNGRSEGQAIRKMLERLREQALRIAEDVERRLA